MKERGTVRTATRKSWSCKPSRDLDTDRATSRVRGATMRSPTRLSSLFPPLHLILTRTQPNMAQMQTRLANQPIKALLESLLKDPFIERAFDQNDYTPDIIDPEQLLDLASAALGTLNTSMGE